MKTLSYVSGQKREIEIGQEYYSFLEWYTENYPEQWKRMQKKKKSPGE